MSTTFGVKVPSLYDEGEFEEIEVAFRSSYIRWKNPLAQLLPDDLEVIPLDNSAQIYETKTRIIKCFITTHTTFQFFLFFFHN